MIERIRPYVAPAFLFLCLLLGGSSQGVWGNAILRLLAILIIAWAVLERRESPLQSPIKQLLILIGLGVLLGLIQLIPLPVDIWASLPGRAQLLAGFRLLGIEPGPMPLSLAPYDTIATLLALLPPLGMIAAMVGISGWSKGWLAAALVAGTVAGVLLGILQVTSADPTNSSWYLYRQSNFGLATGFFANSNHMASLLLASIAFIAAAGAVARDRAKDLRSRSAALLMAGGGLLVVVLGLAMNGSLAGYGLGVPVIVASMLILLGASARIARGALAAAAIAGVAALALLWGSPINRDAEAAVTSRQVILSTSTEVLGEFGALGTGLGTFEKVYLLEEDPAQVDRYRVNHVHNDYFELAIETGVPGIILMLLFLAWWGRAVWHMARSPAADQFAWAGAIASAAMLLHSVVDFPLRTAALSTLFAMCLVLIVQSRRTAHSDADLRPVRHLVVG